MGRVVLGRAVFDPVTGRFGPIPIQTPGHFFPISLSIRSFRPDFRGGSFLPNFGGLFLPTLVYIDFR